MEVHTTYKVTAHGRQIDDYGDPFVLEMLLQSDATGFSSVQTQTRI